jgi:hypothetical protein
LRYRSHPFGVCRPRRAVRGCRPPGPSRSGVFRVPRHPSRGRVALAVFVPRASCEGDLYVRVRAFHRAKQVEAPPVRVIRGWCSSAARVPGPHPGCSRGLAGGTFVRRPGDARGICCNPSQCCPDPAGECASSAPRTHLPFRLAIHREFHRRGTPLLGAGRRIAGPRLLGFGPGGQSCRACWRPRHGFGRTGSTGRTGRDCLGF